MFKKILCVLIIVVFFFIFLPETTTAFSFKDRLVGKILLQVENHGEAWYLNPDNGSRYFLGRPADAFKIMSDLGLGISEKDYHEINNGAPKNLWGVIILRVENLGQAYYVDTNEGLLHYLGKPVDAFRVMQELGLGINNNDLNLIPIDSKSASISEPSKNYTEKDASREQTLSHSSDNIKDSEVLSNKFSENNNVLENKNNASRLEMETFDLINNYRSSLSLDSLTWNDEVANLAREHSQDMGERKVSFGHGGFPERSSLLIDSINAFNIAENVAYNKGFSNPAEKALAQWIDSDGHRLNMEGDYDLSGIGVYKSNSDEFYFTQIFVKQ